MLSEQLATLERAAEPYINSGYRIFSQTDMSLTLIRARPRFSVTAFIILLIILWPLAIVYSVAYRTQRDKVVCLRITSQGYIEETGDALEGTSRRVSFTTAIIICVLINCGDRLTISTDSTISVITSAAYAFV